MRVGACGGGKRGEGEVGGREKRKGEGRDGLGVGGVSSSTGEKTRCC